MGNIHRPPLGAGDAFSFSGFSQRQGGEFSLRLFTTCFVASVCLLLPGCAAPKDREIAMTAKAPNILLGPVVELLRGNTIRDKVKVVLDSTGLGHVIIASTARNEVLHVIVGSEGILHQEVIRSSIAPRNIDAAFDQTGILHVLIDDEYMVRNDDIWRKRDAPPWRQAGFKLSACSYVWGAPVASFVPGGPSLIWAFSVNGKDIGVPTRWDWYAFGGVPAGIVWPWPTGASKLLVVSDTTKHDAPWVVLDPSDSFDACNWQLAADAKGTVSIVYDATGISFIRVAMARYAQFTTGESFPDDVAAEGASNATRMRKALKTVTGQDVDAKKLYSEGRGPDGIGSQVDLAVDPVTGLGLFIRAHTASWLLKDGTWSKKIRLPLGKHWWEPRLASAGNDRFHAMVVRGAYEETKGQGSPINYLAFVNGVWSAPVEIGRAEVSSFWGDIWDAVQIGGNGGEKLLAVWPTKESIAARWVVLQEE